MASPHIASNSVASTTAVSSPVASGTGATPTTSDRVEMSPARVHVWRVLSMLAALIGVVVALVVIASSAV
ncbi:hypothetical protein [Gordonia paraffinivorans]|uniref:Uncharacterized protein n=2 Tax=Gordonia paraffinivorans TaxID=175628 RepID=A0ABQ0IGL9_9ACTN|nr:hypothetical protein [Gordonia paraffinivorans]GAC82726.1 hypothetical protein GP2_004_00430 [Gordonia paraffinivorans NBRC 108238]VFA89640.1 Uncharacterised protein [Gordonia paraffinivorans]